MSKTSTLLVFTCTPFLLAFSLAISNASSLTSHASTSASFNFLAKATAIHPLPVPMSRSLKGERLEVRGKRLELALTFSITHATNSSVSGRGMSTPGFTFSVSPQKSASPKTYWTGSPCATRAASSSKLCRRQSRSLPSAINAFAVGNPATFSSSIRATALASPSGIPPSVNRALISL